MISLLRSVYAWLLIAVVMLPLFPVAWMVRHLTARFDPLRTRLRLGVAQWVSVYGHTTPLYHFDIRGRERLPDGPYVLVANHESGLDVLVLLMLRTPARFLAESRLFRIPLAGGLMRACRHIPLRPGDRESGRRALEVAMSALQEGTPVAIFPEGEISPSGLAELRPGAFVLAQRAGVPVVPVLIEGAAAAWQPDAFVVHGRHEVRVRVLEPVPAAEVTALAPVELIARVRRCLEQARSLPAPVSGEAPPGSAAR